MTVEEFEKARPGDIFCVTPHSLHTASEIELKFFTLLEVIHKNYSYGQYKFPYVIVSILHDGRCVPAANFWLSSIQKME